MGRKCRGFTRRGNLTGALRGSEAKWTLRRGIGLLPVTLSHWRIGRWRGSKTTKDKSSPVLSCAY